MNISMTFFKFFYLIDLVTIRLVPIIDVFVDIPTIPPISFQNEIETNTPLL